MEVTKYTPEEQELARLREIDPKAYELRIGFEKLVGELREIKYVLMALTAPKNN
jgi:hypothetical protein